MNDGISAGSNSDWDIFHVGRLTCCDVSYGIECELRRQSLRLLFGVPSL